MSRAMGAFDGDKESVGPVAAENSLTTPSHNHPLPSNAPSIPPLPMDLCTNSELEQESHGLPGSKAAFRAYRAGAAAPRKNCRAKTPHAGRKRGRRSHSYSEPHFPHDASLLVDLEPAVVADTKDASDVESVHAVATSPLMPPTAISHPLSPSPSEITESTIPAGSFYCVGSDSDDDSLVERVSALDIFQGPGPDVVPESILPPKKRCRRQSLMENVTQLDASGSYAILNAMAQLPARLGGMERKTVKFAADTKVHDGPLHVFSRFEHLIMDFFGSIPELRVQIPLPWANTVVDQYTMTIPVSELAGCFPPIGGRPLSASDVTALLGTQAASSLKAWEELELSAYGSRIKRLQASLAMDGTSGDRLDVALATSEISPSAASGIVDATALAGLLGLEVLPQNGQWRVAAPAPIDHILGTLDERVMPLACSLADVAGFRLPPEAYTKTGPCPGWMASAALHINNAVEENEAEAPFAPFFREPRVYAVASLCTNAPRRYLFEVAPPAAVEGPVSTIYHNEKYASGDALILRGLLALTEDLEVRLRSALVCGAIQALEGGADDEMPGLDCPDFWLEDNPSSLELDDGWEAPDMDERTVSAMTKAHTLAYDKGADAAAAAYAAKQHNVSVPVLPGGGGRSAKVTSQHLLLINQLKMLLRHAVFAFPAASLANSPETLTA